MTLNDFKKWWTDSKAWRHALCAYTSAAGILLTLFGIVILPGTRGATNFMQLMIVFPMILIGIDHIPELFKKSLTFKVSITLILYLFASLFWSEQSANWDEISRFLKRITYMIAIMGGVSLAIPLLRKYQKTSLVLLLLFTLGALYALFKFFCDPSISRLIYHHGEMHPNKTGWMYGLIAMGLTSFIQHHTKRSLKLLLFSALIILFSAVMFTSSRSSILGISLGTLAYSLITRNRRCCPPITALLIAFTIYGTVSATKPTPTATKSLLSTKRLVTRKDSGRFKLWGELYQRMDFKDHIIGKGFLADHSSSRNTEILCHPHSLYISSFLHGGIIALMLHATMSLFVFHRGLKTAFSGRPLLILLAAFSLIPSLTDGSGIIDLSTTFALEILITWIPVFITIASEINPGASETTKQNPIPDSIHA